MAAGSTSTLIHNAACETALLADCHCFCHGAGHQNDLVTRAVSCANTTDHTSLLRDLNRVLGGFHLHARDVATSTRPGRTVPTELEAPNMSLSVRRGATWYEMLLVDEALHAAFVEVAGWSLASTDANREQQKAFVRRVTNEAIGVVGSEVVFTSVVESHVWCSIVAEYLASLNPRRAGAPALSGFANICYPRKSQARTPSSLAAVRTKGFAHLDGAFKAASAGSIPPEHLVAILRLVGSATCADLWQHAAAVRFCLLPFVARKGWAPSKTTILASPNTFETLRLRWQRRGNWPV